MKNISEKEGKQKSVVWICIIICIITLLGCIWLAVIIWQYAKVDEKYAADVIIVLGARTEDDEVSPVYRERLNHAVRLYEEGYADKVILTGGYGKGNLYSDAYNAKTYVEVQGIVSEDILIEEESIITQQNIENAKAIMDENGYQKAIIVSDPLHMKRAMDMADDIGIEAYSSPTPTTKYVSLKSKIPFLAREVFFYTGYKLSRVLQ